MLSHISCMDGSAITLMRASLWLLFVATTAISLFWLLLVLASGFEIWRGSNGVGLTLQSALLLYPVALLIGLKKSSKSLTGTVATFVVGWCVAAAAMLFFKVL
jgi:hypothetical protein